MITEKDLQEAIAECEGQRNPTSSTCIKLAAFYTIRQYMFPDISGQPHEQSVRAEQPAKPANYVDYDSGSEFSMLVKGMNFQDFMEIMDDLMDTLTVINPKLYNGIMQKLSEA